MNSARIEQLRSFLRDTPDDPFLHYALALEYVDEKPDEAMRLFSKLLEHHPGYLATYYHAAALYADLGKRERAAAIYEKGIALAREQNQALALRELQNAYNQFMFEEED